MPSTDQNSGALFIWIIAGFLFLSVTAGGTFLLLYITSPDPADPSIAWYPGIGVTLVAMPWFFWIITFLYRVISRALGFRMVCWDSAVVPDPSHDAAATAPDGAMGAGGGAECETPLKESMAS